METGGQHWCVPLFLTLSPPQKTQKPSILLGSNILRHILHSAAVTSTYIVCVSKELRVAPTSTEGAHVIHVLPAHAALPLLLEGLFLEDVGLPLHRLHTEKREIRHKLTRTTLSAG